MKPTVTSAPLGIGIAVGALLFVVTGQAVWLALGVAIGASLGAAQSGKSDSGDESPEAK